MQQTPEKMSPKLFKKGDKIEVRVQNDTLIWRPATFLSSSSFLHQFYTTFETRSGTDDLPSPSWGKCVNASDVRPAQPPELHRYLKVGEIVEGFCKERKGWMKANVVEILKKSRYTVSFEGGEDSSAEMEQWELRAVRKWVDGSWNPLFLLQQVLQNKSPESELKSRGLVLKIKCRKRQDEMKYREGMLVEVKSDLDGFQDSWFIAVIVKSLRNNNFLVEYRTLRTEDKTEFLKEEVDISCIRHCPPVIKRVKPYEYLELVDAWYNDGWWEGYIVQVFNGCRYMVRFYMDEEMVFEHCKLRPHQEWIDGKWFTDLKVNLGDVILKSSKVNLKKKHSQKTSEPTLKNGIMVEVKSDEEGYQGSWYTAMIVCSLSNDKYLVEYQTLKTDDEFEMLREKAFASYIRPCPPKIVRINHYKMLEEVDVWYNDGWWIGLISKVLDDLKYAVYFWTTNEELIFDHSSLRPHQEWIDGKWIAAFREESQLLVKNKLGKYKGEFEGMGGEPNFMTGMKVEVKSDEQSCRGSWYPTSILKSFGGRKYLVVYQTKRTLYAI